MLALRDDQIGRYELLLELGRGGMAQLFLGRLTGAGGFEKILAIKRILPELAKDAQFKQMFLDEGRLAARLSHPNVCQVFELVDVADELFLSMEYLDGVGWDRLIAACAPGPETLRLAAGVLAQAAEGLHYAHSLRDLDGTPTPVVHRDVSPQNVFVTVTGACKVLDFGVSKILTDGPRTRSGVIKGKLPYMAPEQIRGEPIDGRADVFALGVCVWEALTGARLYDRANDYLIGKAIMEEEVPAIATRWPACPPAVDEVVRRALARDPAVRCATALDFALALRDAAGGAAAANEIADVVRARCGDRLAERAHAVAAAISARRADDLDSAETTQHRAMRSLELPASSLSLELVQARTSDPHLGASATRDLRPRAAIAATATAPTAALPWHGPVQVRTGSTPRLAGVDASPQRASSGELSTDSIAALLPRRRLRPGVVAIIAIVAAAVTAGVVLVVMTRRPTPPAPAGATPTMIVPAAQPIAMPVDAAAPPSDAAALVELPADAAVDRARPTPSKRPARRPGRDREAPEAAPAPARRAGAPLPSATPSAGSGVTATQPPATPPAGSGAAATKPRPALSSGGAGSPDASTGSAKPRRDPVLDSLE